MYTGQVDVISNRATWVSDFYQIVDEDDGSVLNILNPDIGFDCSLYISGEDGCHVATFPMSGGKITVAEGDDGPGIQWVIDMSSDLGWLCAGTYRCGLKTISNGQTNDLILGSIAVIEGNR